MYQYVFTSSCWFTEWSHWGCILYFIVQNYFSKQNSNMEEEKEKKSHYFIYHHLSMETSCMRPKKKELLFTVRSLPTTVKRGQQRSLITAWCSTENTTHPRSKVKASTTPLKILLIHSFLILPNDKVSIQFRFDSCYLIRSIKANYHHTASLTGL